MCIRDSNNNIDRLADDHANAARLAEGLGGLDGMTVHGQNTNMVFCSFDADPVAAASALEAQGIIIPSGAGSTRLVTHLDVSAEDVETTIDAVAKHLAGA